MNRYSAEKPHDSFSAERLQNMYIKQKELKTKEKSKTKLGRIPPKKKNNLWVLIITVFTRSKLRERTASMMAVTDRQTRAASGRRQAPSDTQTPAHSCRPVHTGAISKRLASVTRQGSLLERFYRLALGKRGRHLYAWHGMPRYDCLYNTLIYRARIAPVCTQLDA